MCIDSISYRSLQTFLGCICRCVCTDDYPFVTVNGFETLQYLSPGAPYGRLTLTGNTAVGAVFDGATIDASGFVEFLGCGTYGSTGSKYCCRVDTILPDRFTFYQYNTFVSTIEVSGSVSVGIQQGQGPLRKLEISEPMSMRGLKDEEEKDKEEKVKEKVKEEEREFAQTFYVVPDPESSAPLGKGVTAFGGLVMAVAVFLL
jgi:hypothetical protein